MSASWPSPFSDPIAIRTACQGAVSAAEALRALGVPLAANHRRLREACERFGVDYPRFDASVGPKGRFDSRTPITPLSEILVEDSCYSKFGVLKRRLIDSGMLLNECALCHLGPEWQGKPLTLQLDHINGVRTDNRIGNLRLLCPNCHSQTVTFARRKDTRVVWRCSCGGPKSKRATRCRTCLGRERALDPNWGWRPQWPALPVLLAMVKEYNLEGTGRRLGVTANSIRNHIRTLEKHGVT
jgi:hypothetical protein